MAVARSPNYPVIDLAGALALMAPVLKAENRNKMSKGALAKHLGYTSLNGRALAKIGAVRAYGLIEGMSDDLRVSDDAVVALMAPQNSLERKDALMRCAMKSTLFKSIRADFPDSLPSETNLGFWLAKKGFTPDASSKAAKTYLATMRLVAGESGGYNPTDETSEADMDETVEQSATPERGGKGKSLVVPPDMRHALFAIPQGDVTLIFPRDLGPEGFEDLEAYLKIFFQQQKRKRTETN